MGTSKISLNKIVGDRLHAPRVDGFVLYKRIDGAVETGATTTGTKTEKWEKKAQSVYTSPTNIRRVFITHAGIGVEYYAPIKGLQGVTRWSDFSIDFQEVINDIQNHAATGEPLRYRVVGTGIAAIAKGWVCSNIEEIYFDWSLFLSEELMNFGYGNLFLQFPNSAGNISNPIIEQIFKKTCMNGVSDPNKIQERFPRLKQVAYVEDLYERHQSYKQLGKRPLLDFTTTWVSKTKPVLSPNTTVAAWKIPGVTKINPKYSIKPGTYTYDAEVLTPYFAKLEKDLTKLAYDLKEGKPIETDVSLEGFDTPSNQQIQQTKKTKGALEKSLDLIYGKGGEEDIIRAIAIIYKSSTKADRLADYNELTPEGQERYGRYMKLGIK